MVNTAFLRLRVVRILDTNYPYGYSYQSNAHIPNFFNRIVWQIILPFEMVVNSLKHSLFANNYFNVRQIITNTIV